MRKMIFNMGNFQAEGWTELLFESCPNCKRSDLRYPSHWFSADCPDCHSKMPGAMFFHKEHNRRHYHVGLKSSSIGNLLLVKG